jgi:fatty acid amide hydrolase
MNLWQLPATELSSLLARGQTSAVEVLEAHFARIDRLDSQLHAFTELLRDRARADAAAADARRKRGESRGPLDGVPVSVKECFDIEGRPTTLGIPSWRERIADRDAALVTVLREAGAVVFGRTNLSQAMLYVEARNPLFGQTANPWSFAHTPGGSSGGEGAAIAAGMSPLGVGTDIGGSIRTPCHFCGICGIKPSLDRLTMRGYRSVLTGQESVRGMGGPMARSVADLFLFFRALDARRMSELDPRVAPATSALWDTVKLEGLGVGAYENDGVLAPSAAVARATKRASDALRARGCLVRDFALPNIRPVLEAYLGVMSADNGAALFTALAQGGTDPVLQPMKQVASLPAGVRRMMARVADATGQTSFALMLGSMGAKTAAELWRLTAMLRDYRYTLLEAMKAQGVEVLLCPPVATAALVHGGSKNFTLASSYSIVFNAVQFPAGVVPVTRVRKDETERPANRDWMHKRAAAMDAQSEGLPVGVQVVAPPWKDHLALSVMAAIEAEVSREPDFPRTPVQPRPSPGP